MANSMLYAVRACHSDALPAFGIQIHHLSGLERRVLCSQDDYIGAEKNERILEVEICRQMERCGIET